MVARAPMVPVGAKTVVARTPMVAVVVGLG